MAAQKVVNFPIYNNDFLENFADYGDFDFTEETKVKLEYNSYSLKKKLNPILKIAEPDHAKIIAELIKEVYDGTYPYKEMEDEHEVKRMIESGNTIFILFMNKKREIIGSTCFVLDFKAKRGNMRTWVMKKEYHGNFESTKSLIGCCLCIWPQYKDQIYMWYGEVRTAHAKTQYILNLCTLKPVGFYPNKDVFYDKIESDILQVSYDKRALHQYRCTKIPTLLPNIKELFLYTDKRYGLGSYTIVEPVIEINENELNNLRSQLTKEIDTDKYGYATIKFSFQDSDSYLEFLYTPLVQNFEKTKYKVKSLEELYILIEAFKKCAKDVDVRYYEVFVSAYNPYHQKLFFEQGLSPRGYVPSWHYNCKKDCFEDRILFNYCNGPIDNKMTVYDENKALLDTLGFTMY